MLHQVGVGALGPVFRTYEPTRDRLVAVKVFRLDITPEQAQALADELSRAADAGLFHPSIVEPIAAGIEGTVAYRAEEYVAAETLDVALRHYAPAPIEKVLPFITQLAGAIDFARASNVGHGALHPRDIFITPEEARATGFGVVEALERVGQRAPVRRPYSAPERVAGAAWSTPADVFSLGVIAFELLTGRRPAGTGANVGPLEGATPESGTDQVHAVLVRAMEEDPARRFQSALAFASALEAAARGEAPNSADLTAAIVTAPLAAEAADFRLKPEASDDVQDVEEDALTYEPEPLPVPDDLIEDAVDEMPPPAGIDEREEPAEAELEEELFRAEEPPVEELPLDLARDEAPLALDDDLDDLDEVLDEEDEEEPEPGQDEKSEEDAEPEPVDRAREFSDDLASAGIAAAAPRHLFDDAGSEPEPEPELEIEEPVAPPRYASVVEPPGTVSRGPDFGSALAESQQRSPILPYALVGIVCLLIGFGAGAYWRGAPTVTPAPPSASAPAAADSGKAYSEQAVTPQTPPQGPVRQPPAEPPTVPNEVPGATPSSAAKPAPAPARPAATSGAIVVTSTPSRAGVTLDGVWRGRTPLTLDKLKFGSYIVRVVQPGYAVAREQITVTPDVPSQSIAVTLRRVSRSAAATTPAPAPAARAGELYVDSRPRGATVFLDGKAVGVTPLRLSDVEVGPHGVRLELKDHNTWRTSTNITAGREARVTGSLERIR